MNFRIGSRGSTHERQKNALKTISGHTLLEQRNLNRLIELKFQPLLTSTHINRLRQHECIASYHCSVVVKKACVEGLWSTMWLCEYAFTTCMYVLQVRGIQVEAMFWDLTNPIKAVFLYNTFASIVIKSSLFSFLRCNL